MTESFFRQMDAPGRRCSQLVYKSIATASDICGVLAATMMVAAVGITCQMIYVRKVNNASSVWQTEVVTLLMVAATIIGLPYVQRLRGHVNVDLVARLLSPAGRKLLAIVTLTSAIVVIAVMLFYGSELWLTAFQRGWRTDSVVGIPLWIPYLAMPVGFGLFVLQLLADLFAVIFNIDAPFGLDHPGKNDNAAEPLAGKSE